MRPFRREHHASDPVPASDHPRVHRRRALMLSDARAHERFGGLDLPAVIVGLLVAIAAQLILWAAYGAIAGSTVDVRQDTEELALGTLVAGVIIMLLAYLAGGWAAARMSRYDGVRNGIAVPILALIFAALVGALTLWAGDRFDVLSEIGLPNWVFNAVDELGNEALIAAIAAPLAMLLGGALGGRIGDSYHRRVDAELAHDETDLVAERPVSEA